MPIIRVFKVIAVSQEKLSFIKFDILGPYGHDYMYLPHQCRQGNILCEIFELFYAGLLLLQLDVEDIFFGHGEVFFVAVE